VSDVSKKQNISRSHVSIRTALIVEDDIVIEIEEVANASSSLRQLDHIMIDH
jgi:hypothetical protein